MNAFWRTTPLTADEATLLQLTLEAHAASAFRQNVSSVVLLQAAAASGEYTKAVCGALSTLGGTHAPIEATYDLLARRDVDDCEDMIREGRRLPGWGNSFHKGAPDPLWQNVAEQLRKCNATLSEKLDTVTEMLLASGKRLYPNPSAYTAAVAITLGLNRKLASWLFVQGRLLSWSQLYNQAVKGEA